MVKQITLKLDRSQLAAVDEYFLPYLEMQVTTWMRDCEHDVNAHLNACVISCIHQELVQILRHRLTGPANRFQFKFSTAQAITLYKLLMCLPINYSQVWLINLRQLITDTLHQQLLKTVVVAA